MASPAVDGGDNAAPQLPPTDLDGNNRIADGNQDGDARVDIGAYEYTNQPPVADAGADQMVTAAASCRATVALDGSRSSDADGDPLSFTWSGAFGTVAGATALASLPAGTHPVTLTVDDGRGGSSSDTLLVTAVDATPPAIQSAAATPPVLSPANHQLVTGSLGVSASDSCGGSVSCRIASVTSNEPLSGDDWIITGNL